MAMENPFEGKEIWFGVGSQDLYGEEALRQVAQQTGEMVDFLNATGKIPAKIVLKPTLKSSDGVKAFMTEEVAHTMWAAKQLGDIIPISQEDIDSLNDRYTNVYGQH